MESITEKQVLLTPELARAYIMKNDPRQRHMNTGHAGTLARDIVRGAWDSRMSEPIDFSTEGYMINGQHRCMAVIKAGQPIRATVRENCPPEWFEKYDRAKPRSVTDYYKGKEAKTCAGVATFAICIESGASLWDAVKGRIKQTRNKTTRSNHGVAPTVGEKVDYIREHEEDVQFFASAGCKCYRVARMGSKATFACALWYLEHLGADRTIISNMIDDFCDPATINANVATIKTWYMKQMPIYIKNRMRPPQDMLFAVVLAVYEGYMDSTPIKQPKRAIEKAWNKYVAVAEESRGNK